MAGFVRFRWLALSTVSIRYMTSCELRSGNVIIKHENENSRSERINTTGKATESWPKPSKPAYSLRAWALAIVHIVSNCVQLFDTQICPRHKSMWRWFFCPDKALCIVEGCA